MEIIDNYLQSARKQLENYKLLGEKAIDQLSEENLFWQYNPESNSISIIIRHLYGNMKSRWTDFLSSDGEKEWRDRDGEFEQSIATKAELISKWNEGWACLFEALDSIHSQNIQTIVYIRNQKHTIPEAINRQMMHYASHIGQIIYIGRMLKGADWISLSIPKGKSQEFNQDKFSQGKH